MGPGFECARPWYAISIDGDEEYAVPNDGDDNDLDLRLL